jgi:hypothetical protein
VALLEWADRTLRYLNNSAAFRDTVLLAVVATPGGADLGPGLLQPGGARLLAGTPSAASAPSAPAHSSGGNSGGAMDGGGAGALPATRPLQSWQQLGSGAAAVDARRPAVCLRRLPGVIRVDDASQLGLAECLERGCMVGTLADQLLAEIAYKVGRAPKYGA